MDDAGSGDLLFGVVIGAYRDDTQEFKYDVIDVKFFQQIFPKKNTLLEHQNRFITSYSNPA